MPVMMYKDDEQQIVENCLVDKMKAEGWELRTLEETVKFAEKSSIDSVELDEPKPEAEAKKPENEPVLDWL